MYIRRESGEKVPGITFPEARSFREDGNWTLINAEKHGSFSVITRPKIPQLAKMRMSRTGRSPALAMGQLYFLRLLNIHLQAQKGSRTTTRSAYPK